MPDGRLRGRAAARRRGRARRAHGQAHDGPAAHPVVWTARGSHHKRTSGPVPCASPLRRRSCARGRPAHCAWSGVLPCGVAPAAETVVLPTAPLRYLDRLVRVLQQKAQLEGRHRSSLAEFVRKRRPTNLATGMPARSRWA